MQMFITKTKTKQAAIAAGSKQRTSLNIGVVDNVAKISTLEKTISTLDSKF